MKFVIFLLTITLSVCAQAAKSDTLKQKAGETMDAASDYAVETKEEFKAKMSKNLTLLEEDIADLKSRAAAATGEARVTLNRQIEDLEVRREALRERFEKFSSTSGRAWRRMKTGLEKAWGDVKVAYSKAETEFEKEEKAAATKKSQNPGN